MPPIPSSVDLSGGKSPEDFFVCLIDDPAGVEAWRASKAPFDYTRPSSSWCGLTCLRMTLLADDKEAPSLDELFARACASDVYVWGEVREHGPGWRGAFLPEFTAFVGQFGYNAQFVQGMDTERVARALAKSYYVFPRVGADIRYLTDEEPAKKDGHFVFMYGYETGENGERRFLINNSGGFASLGSQVGVPIPETRLAQLFSGDAILVRSHRA